MVSDNTRERILLQTNNGLDVFNYYLPDIQLPTKKTFKSPFYEDSKPSCTVFLGRNGTWLYKDHGDGGTDFGDCFWFTAKLKGLDIKADFPQVLYSIVEDLSLNIPVPNTLLSGAKENALASERRERTKKATKVSLQNPNNNEALNEAKVKPYKYEARPFTENELRYWGYYGITTSVLSRYRVQALNTYTSERSADKGEFTIRSSEAEPMYLYEFGPSVKVYRPFSSLRFLQAGLKLDKVVFGLDNLPMKGDIVFITGGEKDVMSFAAKGFHAICFNSETSGASVDIIDMLRRRFRHIIVCYDVDDTGRKASKNLVEQFKNEELFSLELPLKGTKDEKDISDYFALGKTRNDFRQYLMQVLDAKIYTQTAILLKSCEIDTLNPPTSSRSVITIQETVLGSYDNLLCITGGEGTGKSNFVASLIAGAISPTQLVPETTLGLRVESNPDNLAVLHYDTEQSDAQLYKNMQRAMRRAGLADKPEYYHPICLTSFSRRERLQLIKNSMDMYYHKHGGLHLVVIDGIADLITSANNESESVAIVEEIYRLAGIYNTCVVCVLHLTPTGMKIRGHIGSELQRKAAGIISIEKDKGDQSLSVVKALKVRDGDPLDVSMITIGWDKAKNMQVYKGTKSYEEKEERKYNELTSLASRIMKRLATNEDKSISSKDFEEALKTELGFKDKRTVSARVEYMRSHHIIDIDEMTDRISLCESIY